MSNLKLIQLNNYVKPIITENKSKGYVTNGVHNSYFKYVNDRYIGSPTNSAILNGYKSWVYGKGISATDQNKKPSQYARLYTMLKDKDVKSIVSDYVIQGMAYIQIIRNRDNTISSIEHIAVDKIAPEKANEDNIIEAYYYSHDFKDNKIEPTRIKAFGFGDKYASIEIYAIRHYQLGMEYFALPSYQSCLQWAELEEEISNYSINHMRNGLSTGYIINIPDSYNLDDEAKSEIEKKIKRKLTGSSRAGTFMINFANGENSEISVTNLEVNDAHKQWNFLSEESSSKILIGHECVSPMLFGVKDASGFSSNADELAESERQTIERVINPKQNSILRAFTDILLTDDITLNLYFIPLAERKTTSDGSFTGVQISSAIDIITKVKTGELTQREASSLLKSMLGYPEEELKTLFKTNNITSLSSQVCCSSDDKKKSDLAIVLESYALDPPSGYDLFLGDEKEVNLSAIQNSEQDTDLWKIRYTYTIGTSKTPKGSSREFCNKMVSLSDSGKVFRKEDIEKMSADGVNGQFAHSGGKYDIFLYGGGVNCYHRWERRIFKKKRQEDGELYKGNAMQNTKEVNVNEARRQGAKIPKNAPDVAIAEITKENKGKYPS